MKKFPHSLRHLLEFSRRSSKQGWHKVVPGLTGDEQREHSPRAFFRFEKLRFLIALGFLERNLMRLYGIVLACDDPCGTIDDTR